MDSTTTPKEKVAPTAHFAEAHNVEYEYETHDVTAAAAHDDDHHDQARRRASRRVSRRESIAGNAAPFDVSYHPGAFILYCPPKQRQQWGDSQVLPRVDFGDLFFDLFFVAAAYNTSNILVDSPSGRGLLYFLGTFYAVMGMWLDKVFYDSRFVVCGDDLFHRVFELVRLVVLATAVLHIRTIDIMSNGKEYVDTFYFCLVVLIGNLLIWCRYLEIYFFGVGQPVIKREAIRCVRMTAPYVALLLAATIIAGIEFYGNSSDYDENELGYASSNTTEAYDGEAHADDDHDRMLAGASSSSSLYAADEKETFDLPMYLILGGTLFRWIYIALDIRFCFPGGGRHKELVVPLNVDFTIHRNGEWNMLMLGESILSLLIVDVTENNDYYATFYSSLLTVILLQYLHFRSQPHNADGHALRRNKDAGIAWSCFHQIYSAALIAFGSSITLLILEFTYPDDDGDHRRFLAGGGGAANLDPEDRRQRVAHLFCGSLVIIWFCIDCMTLFHLGLKDSQGRCRCEKSKRFNVKGILLVICRVGLLAFMATLSQYETDPQNLAVFGLMGVVLQLVLRKLGTMYLSADQVHALEGEEGGEDPESLKWPNVTHAQAHPPAKRVDHE